MPLSHRTHEQRIPPAADAIARVPQHPAGCDCGRPHPDRLFHSLLRDDSTPDWSAVVLPAVRNDWPAVIRASLDDVQLVAVQRSVFVLPQDTRPGVEREPLRIAMPVAPDFWPRPLFVHEWVVRRNAAVIV